MDDRAPTTDLTQCLSPQELAEFLSIVKVPFDYGTVMGGLKAVIVHATSGDVAWVWMEKLGAFCWKIPGLPI